MQTKGISPVVAAALLIAATMMIAGILSYWASSYVKRTLEVKENETTKVLCSGAEMEIYGTPSYNETTKNVTMFIHNVYGHNLGRLKATIIYPTNVKEVLLNKTVKASYEFVVIENVDPGFKEIKLISTNCPNVEVTWRPS